MNVIRVKAGVKFDRIAPAGARILGALDKVARDVRHDLTISCGTEGHPPADEHTLGEAYDVSIREFSVEQLIDIRARLIAELGPLFTVLYERKDKPADARLQVIVYLNAGATAPHLHVQRKKGTVYPPSSTPTTVQA